MAQYFTDFSEYTAGSLPSDFTEVAGSGVATVVDNSGNKALKYASSTTTVYQTTWNDIDADADRANVEILTKLRVGSLTTSVASPAAGVLARESSSTSYYVCGPRDSSTFRLRKSVSGTLTTLVSATVSTISVNTWYWMRLRVNGTSIKSRWWADGSGEPSTWDIDTTDSSLSAAGAVGTFSGNNSNTTDGEFDVFGVGTNGDTAPDSAGGTPVTITCTPGNAVAAGTSATINSAVTLVATPGNAVANGTQATINSAVTVTCTVGDAQAAGITAAIQAGGAVTIECTPGNAAAAGTSATINSAVTLVATPGNAVANGTQAAINSAVTVTCTVGDAQAAGITAAIQAGGAVTITCTIGDAVAAGTLATIASNVVIGASIGNAVAAGLGASIVTADTVTCTVGDATGAGVTAIITAAGTLTCTPGNAVAAGVDASVDGGQIEFTPCLDHRLYVQADSRRLIIPADPRRLTIHA